MKRFVSLLFAVMLMLSASIMCRAETGTTPTQSQIQEKFTQWANTTYYGGELSPDDYAGYMDIKDIYPHTAEDKSVDWVLLHVKSWPSPAFTYSMRIGDRIISGEGRVFKTGYGIFDVEQDSFFDLYELTEKADNYPGLLTLLDQLKIGRPIGDADNDQTLTVLDATKIQRLLADLEPSWLYNESYILTAEFSLDNPPRYLYLDRDGDGAVNILDATAIQRHLADL